MGNKEIPGSDWKGASINNFLFRKYPGKLIIGLTLTENQYKIPQSNNYCGFNKGSLKLRAAF